PLHPPSPSTKILPEDLKDLGEIGRGAYGSVNKMVHKPSGQIMAVKVGDAHTYVCTSVHLGLKCDGELMFFHLSPIYCSFLFVSSIKAAFCCKHIV
uniref:Protein kinase domain-containing protein n=1 Tax=Apteryx owenii TaxID=8824 RepID=A0A8B9QCH8_APTOW